MISAFIMRRFTVKPLELAGVDSLDGLANIVDAVAVANALYFYCEWDKDWKQNSNKKLEQFNAYPAFPFKVVVISLDRKLAKIIADEKEGLYHVIMFDDFPGRKSAKFFRKSLGRYIRRNYVE